MSIIAEISTLSAIDVAESSTSSTIEVVENSTSVAIEIAENSTLLTIEIAESSTSSTIEIVENNTSSTIEIAENNTSSTFETAEIIASTTNIVSKSKKKLLNSRDIKFRYKNDLLYFTSNLIDSERLCISKFIKTEIFRQIHDFTHYNNFIKIYDKLRHFIYVRFIIKRFKTYITHCSKCQINHIKLYSVYNELNSIMSLIISFHTIVMNFIIALLFSKKFDVLLIIICKFSKKVLFIVDHNIWNVVE